MSERETTGKLFVCVVLMVIVNLLILTGCTPQTEPDFRPAIACELAMGSMQVVEPTPAPDVSNNCDGSGWITQGDGHKTKCPGCPACAGDMGEYGSLLGISDATKAVTKTCSKVDAAIDKLMDGGLNIKVGDEPTLAPWLPPAVAPCVGGQCPTRQATSVAVTATVKRTTQPRRLFWRLRRGSR